MAISVNELAQTIEQVTLTTAINVGNKGGMKMCKAFYNDTKPLMVKLAEEMELSCPFEPSAYKGTGEEERVGIVIRITSEIYDAFAALENHCREQLEADGIQHVNNLWCSAIRADKYGHTLRCKINIKGERAAYFWDSDGQLTVPPPELKNLPINAQVHMRGVNIQKATIGLLADVVSLQYGTEPVEVEKKCPF